MIWFHVDKNNSKELKEEEPKRKVRRAPDLVGACTYKMEVATSKFRTEEM